MNYINRFHELNDIFKLGVDTKLNQTLIDIRFCSFQSNFHNLNNKSNCDNVFSDEIHENNLFSYPVFVPRQLQKMDNAILLIHGLNERNWNKYLTWAEYLCKKTGKAVILFPLAYHINRSPGMWSNPRSVKNAFDIRQEIYGQDRTLSFANVALSERITQNPNRFYSSGLQSIKDLENLLSAIKNGDHPFFKANTKIDVFAYSIGALLSQVAFLSNPGSLFTDSKLFMLCGGSIFSAMVGKTRLIMDKVAFEKLLAYYSEEFLIQNSIIKDDQKIRSAFFSMIAPEHLKHEREAYFESMGNRLSGISLKKDKVIPYAGVKDALGHELSNLRIELLDFEYEYCHENPFPVSIPIHQKEAVNQAFEKVFSFAADFLK